MKIRSVVLASLLAVLFAGVFATVRDGTFIVNDMPEGSGGFVISNWFQFAKDTCESTRPTERVALCLDFTGGGEDTNEHLEDEEETLPMAQSVETLLYHVFEEKFQLHLTHRNESIGSYMNTGSCRLGNEGGIIFTGIGDREQSVGASAATYRVSFDVTRSPLCLFWNVYDYSDAPEFSNAAVYARVSPIDTNLSREAYLSHWASHVDINSCYNHLAPFYKSLRSANVQQNDTVLIETENGVSVGMTSEANYFCAITVNTAPS